MMPNTQQKKSYTVSDAVYTSELQHRIPDTMEYDLDKNYNIDSSISQLTINNANTDYNTENGQPDQPVIINSTLARHHCLNQSQRNQLSIKACTT